MSLTNAEIKELLAVLEASDWDDVQVIVGDVTVTASRNTPASARGSEERPPVAAPITASAPLAPQEEVMAPAPAGGEVVASPSVGIFWRSPEPGAPPFVEPGSRVSAGQTLCIIEIMKLMNPVVAEADGIVTAVHCENGAYVEFGSPLFSFTAAEG